MNDNVWLPMIIVRDFLRYFGRVERSYNNWRIGMKILAAVPVVCFAFCLVQGQEPCAPPKIVKTTGTAEMKITPDRAVIRVGVERQSTTAKSAKAAVDNVSRKILATLKTATIDEKDIQTAYLDLQPTSYYEKHVRINNFTATQSLSITIHDLSRLDNVMDAVMSAGANRIDGIEYQSSELRKYRDQARDEAAKAAKEKAVALAQALGNQVGKTYSIEEVQQWDNSVMGGLSANVALERNAAPPPSTAPGQLTVTASVIVSFDLL
jgi:uncharacterized protein